jgi:hypothetical protein
MLVVWRLRGAGFTRRVQTLRAAVLVRGDVRDILTQKASCAECGVPRVCCVL